MNRRDFLWSGAAATALIVGTGAVLRAGGPKAALAAETFEVTKTDAEWHAILSDEAFDVLRKQGTEYPGTSPLLNEHRKGIFACAGCALPLFSSATKYDSGTGWPSFWKPLPDAVRTTSDFKIGYERTEVHCRRCGGHLGHVFDDGPPPSGKRYCMNGAALSFVPAKGDRA